MEVGEDSREHIQINIGIACDIKSCFHTHSLLTMNLCLAQLFLIPSSLCPLQGPTHSQEFKPQPGGYI